MASESDCPDGGVRTADRRRHLFTPTTVYFERGAEAYPLGARLLAYYGGESGEAPGVRTGPSEGPPVIFIDDHNRVPQMRALPDSEFVRKKKVLVVGVRKSLRLVPNALSADYIVPFTSSGCPAMCLYCYLTCTFFSNSYLRLFVNRERMWEVIERRARRAMAEGERGHAGGEPLFEIGSNSDMIVDEAVSSAPACGATLHDGRPPTGNLVWAVERFSRLPYGRATFSTKFAAVEPLLGVDPRGRTRVRMSVNPAGIVRRVEVGTSPLTARLKAANLLHQAGYEVGLNLAPVILTRDWRREYGRLLETVADVLTPNLRDNLYLEVIFMTYGLATAEINRVAFGERRTQRPRTTSLLAFHRPELMRAKGRGKTCYADPYRAEAEEWLRREIRRVLPGARVGYVC